VISVGGLHLIPKSKRVNIKQTEILLRPMEFKLLHYLMTHPDIVLTRDQLLKEVWGNSTDIGERAVDAHILRLRTTLQGFGLSRIVQTVHGLGYLFSDKFVAQSANNSLGRMFGTDYTNCNTPGLLYRNE
jgi:two-component system phosphate regulon response regulator PhoB